MGFDWVAFGVLIGCDPCLVWCTWAWFGLLTPAMRGYMLAPLLVKVSNM